MTSVRMKRSEMQNVKWILTASVFCLTFFLLLTTAYAQPTVLVNGIRLEQVDNSTLNGIDYVEVQELSDAIGAEWRVREDANTVQINLAGQFLELPIAASVEEALVESGLLELRQFDIRENRSSTAGIYLAEKLMIPLKSVIRAFGGSADYVEEINSVIAVFERAKLTVLNYPQQSSSVERFVFNLSVPVNYKVQDLKSLSVLNILFSQTTSDLSSQSIVGRGFQKASFRDFAGDVEFRLELTSGFKADIFNTTPESGRTGVNVIVDILSDVAYEQRYASASSSESDSGATVISTIGTGAPDTELLNTGLLSTEPLGTERLGTDMPNAEASNVLNVDTTNVPITSSLTGTVISSIGVASSGSDKSAPSVTVDTNVSPVTRSSQIVLDPVPFVGANAGVNFSELDVSFDFAQSVARELQQFGYSSAITRSKGDVGQSESRRNAGLGAAAFISISQADLAAGTFNLYYLGEADSLETLDLALRRNAENELRTIIANTQIIQTDETAALRRRLLLNLSSGVDEAAVFAQTVSDGLMAQGFRAQTVQALPLYILGGAVGKGLVLEVSQADMMNPQFSSALVQAIMQLNLR